MNTVQVAAAIICRNFKQTHYVDVPSEKQLLISYRHPALHQGGLWEFPGGKIEAGESPIEALERELYEELGIKISTSKFLFKIEHQYPDKKVCLHIILVKEYKGKEFGKEDQKIQWVAPEELKHLDFPAANKPIIEYILKEL